MLGCKDSTQSLKTKSIHVLPAKTCLKQNETEKFERWAKANQKKARVPGWFQSDPLCTRGLCREALSPFFIRWKQRNYTLRKNNFTFLNLCLQGQLPNVWGNAYGILWSSARPGGDWGHAWTSGRVLSELYSGGQPRAVAFRPVWHPSHVGNLLGLPLKFLGQYILGAWKSAFIICPLRMLTPLVEVANSENHWLRWFMAALIQTHPVNKKMTPDENGICQVGGGRALWPPHWPEEQG